MTEPKGYTFESMTTSRSMHAVMIPENTSLFQDLFFSIRFSFQFVLLPHPPLY